jgi:hypothetical protein
MEKTYALLDLVGISNQFANNTAASTLESFWSAADVWATAQTHSPVRVPHKGYSTTPEVFVSTFSDSALLHSEPELAIEDFFRIVKNFKAFIEGRACSSYVVISRHNEVVQHQMPALGGHLMSADHRPLYQGVAGSGDAWVNLHLADAAIKKKRDWHDVFSVYCVGERSLPSDVRHQDSIECRGLSGTTRIFAIE